MATSRMYRRYALIAIDRDSRIVHAAGFSDKMRALDLSKSKRVQIILEMGQGASPREAQDNLRVTLEKRELWEWFLGLCAEGAETSTINAFE